MESETSVASNTLHPTKRTAEILNSHLQAFSYGASELYRGNLVGLSASLDWSVSPLTVFPLAGLGLGVGSLASPTPHGPRSSPNATGLPSTPSNHSPPHRSADHQGAVPVNPFPPPKLEYLLFSYRTVATSHTVLA